VIDGILETTLQQTLHASEYGMPSEQALTLALFEAEHPLVSKHLTDTQDEDVGVRLKHAAKRDSGTGEFESQIQISLDVAARCLL
jgi:hypothetical protein